MILHRPYGVETDALTKIKEDLELRETVLTLDPEGVRSGTFDSDVNAVRAVRPPGVNYVIGHGALGIMQDQMANEPVFAKELVARGLQRGDELVLIVCSSGRPAGAAERLADALGALGVTGVKVTGALEYVHWTSQGPLLVKEYPQKSKAQSAAERAYTAAEDKAWARYVTYLKARSIKAMRAGFPKSEQAVCDRIVAFGRSRTGQNLADLRKHLSNVEHRLNTEAALTNIVSQATPNYERYADGKVIRETSHAIWSADLRSLMTDLYKIVDPVAGEQKAKGKITKARTALRDALTPRWPEYSESYYGELGRLLDANTRSKWVSYTSAVNVIAVPVALLPPTTQVLRTVEETAVAETDSLNAIDQLLSELDDLL